MGQPLISSIFMGLWLLGTTGRAQTPPPVTFTFDSLLVATIQAEDSALQARADELQAQLEEAAEANMVVVGMSEVPPFEEQGYDGRTYALGCPVEQYTGCALVLGQRARAEYAVGGTLARVDEGLGEGQLFTVHMVDVEASREVLHFGVVVGEGRDPEVLAGIAGLFDRIVEGALDDLDVRGDLDDPRVAAQVEAERARVLASSLDALEAEIGEVLRSDPITLIRPPRVTRESLQEYRERDDISPWQRIGMEEGEFVRFQNSGLILEEWKRRSRGRFGQVLFGVSAGGGSGSFGVHHEARYLQSFDAVTDSFFVSQIDQVQELRQGGHIWIEGELMLGVAPFAEVGVVFGGRSSPASFLFDQDREDEPSIVGNPSRTSINTAYFGARGGVILLPVRSVRPSAHLGIMSWRGISLPLQSPTKPLDAPTRLYLTVAPGAEVSAGRYLNLFLRGVGEIPVAGRYADTYRQPYEGEGTGLRDLVPPTDEAKLGFGVQAGFQVRLTVIPDKRRVGGPVDYDDEEEEL